MTEQLFFQDIYLDLGFVEAMLKTCGPVDLLNDYKKYGDLIMGKVSSMALMFNSFSWNIIVRFIGITVP